MMNLDSDDLILNGKGKLRGRRHEAIGKGDVYAVIHLGKHRSSYDFSHPSLNLMVDYIYHGIKNEDGTTHTDAKTLASFCFQRNNAHLVGEYDRLYSGFLGPGGHCYAGRVEFNLDEMSKGMAGLEIAQRAKDAIRKLREYDYQNPLNRALNRAGCELITLMVSLQQIGVPIVVKHGKRASVKQYSLVA